MKAIPLAALKVKSGFWHDRMETNRKSTIPAIQKQVKRRPHSKTMEAMAYSLLNHPDARMARELERGVDALEKQRAESSVPLGCPPKEKLAQRMSNLRDSHALYQIGHWMEAAVAHHEATGEARFLKMASLTGDYLCRTFGRGKRKRRGYPGHQEVELALVRLYEATGTKKYLDQAEYFLDERARKPHLFDKEAKARGEKPSEWRYWPYTYNQSHAPVREQDQVVGHAVRAMYMYCGMTDVAELTGDKELMKACRKLWKNLVQRRMHVTGGIGPAEKNEGFTYDYDLPSEGAYLETCAAIGLVLWAHRMLNAHEDGQYADVMERALYNGTICGVSLDGTGFFYENPLAVYPGFNGRATFEDPDYHYRRKKWFTCACCPPNIARLIAQFPRFIYSAKDRSLFVNLYADSTVTTGIGNQQVTVAQKTDYPWDGRVKLTVTPEKAATWTLALRIPGWCRKVSAKVNGRSINLATCSKKGYARIKREWKKGDKVELVLAMPAERVYANPSSRDTGGRVTLQRGPLVYCLESADNGPRLNHLFLPGNAKLTTSRDRSIPGNPVVIKARGKRRSLEGWGNALYSTSQSGTTPATIKAVPYFMWANREPGEMLTWIREIAR